MEITPGVHSFPQTIDESGRTIHPAAVETAKGLILVDVGFAHELDSLVEHLGDVDHDWDDVHSVLLTHQDGDHVGGLRDVVDRTKTNVTVFAHERAAPYVDGREDPIKGDGERYPPVPVDVEIVDGVRLRTEAGPMRAVFTPGHAPGHVSLYLPEARLLLAADALTADDRRLRGPSERFTLDMDEAVASVGTLADLDVDRTLCYHGGLVDEGTARIEALSEELP